MTWYYRGNLHILLHRWVPLETCRGPEENCFPEERHEHRGLRRHPALLHHALLHAGRWFRPPPLHHTLHRLHRVPASQAGGQCHSRPGRGGGRRRVRELLPDLPGLPYRPDHEDLQAGQEVRRSAGHGAHSEDQLEGPGAALHAGRDGDVGLRQPPLLHWERRWHHRRVSCLRVRVLWWKSGCFLVRFVSIPAGMWWAVQTLTSLGYGDYWPESFLGKLMGSACAVCGVLVMALPIPIVVDNFANYYR